MQDGLRSPTVRLAPLLAVVVLLAGCGGGKQSEPKTTFTNGNWADVQFNSATGKLDGSPVDVTGPVFLVDNQEPDGVWFAIYADKAQSFRVLVHYGDLSFQPEENDVVHVVGKIDQSMQTPDMVMWDEGPIVDAGKAKILSG